MKSYCHRKKLFINTKKYAIVKQENNLKPLQYIDEYSK